MTSSDGFFSTPERLVRRASSVLATGGAALLLLYAMATVADVAMRGAFGKPIRGLEDIATLVIPVIAASFIPYVTIERANIRATILGQRLGPKISARLDLFGDAALLAFLAIVAFQFAAYAIDARRQTTMILLAPVAPSFAIVSVLLGFSVLAQGVAMARELARETPGRGDEGG